MHPTTALPTSPVAMLARLDAEPAGPHADAVATGFPTLDRMLGGGVRRGDLTVLGGDAGSGKSALALAVALRAARAGARTLVLSTEMTPARATERLLAMDGRVSVAELRRGTLDDETRARVAAAALRLEERAPCLTTLTRDGAGGVLAEIRARPWDLVVVDSLQGLGASARPRDEELAAAVGALKGAAMERDLALVVTAHPPALTRGRDDCRPRLDDYGALGAVKHLADVVLALYRAEMYEPGHGIEGATELLVQKNRHGATGYIDLFFYARWLRFEDMVE